MKDHRGEEQESELEERMVGEKKRTREQSRMRDREKREQATTARQRRTEGGEWDRD